MSQNMFPKVRIVQQDISIVQSFPIFSETYPGILKELTEVLAFISTFPITGKWKNKNTYCQMPYKTKKAEQDCSNKLNINNN